MIYPKQRACPTCGKRTKSKSKDWKAAELCHKCAKKMEAIINDGTNQP